ncbi:BlaI/MecI/CopY family transcriptional regulator [Glaciecola sp. MF2-115]|uniref:BlaI/MecI/CopY family transcriptional regulator n=1 Tax=Glaciecola sp. MF2-115 TaxID=3384827 RepID=UPI0039A39041
MQAEISDTEYEVISVIWDAHPATAKDILERLNTTKEFHPKTVNTLLNRLVKKQAISYQKDGRAFKYSPLIEKENYVKRKCQHFLSKMFDGKVSPLVANFASHDILKKDDIEDLKKLIQEWEDKND